MARQSEAVTSTRTSTSTNRQTKIGIIAVFIGGAALLSIVMLAVFFQGKSTDVEKAQSVVAPLEGTNKSNAPPSDIMAAQNRLIEPRFLKGPADGVWGPSRGTPCALSRSQTVLLLTTNGTIS
jgi:hypothetical protein